MSFWLRSKFKKNNKNNILIFISLSKYISFDSINWPIYESFVVPFVTSFANWSTLHRFFISSTVTSRILIICTHRHISRSIFFLLSFFRMVYSSIASSYFESYPLTLKVELWGVGSLTFARLKSNLYRELHRIFQFPHPC